DAALRQGNTERPLRDRDVLARTVAGSPFPVGTGRSLPPWVTDMVVRSLAVSRHAGAGAAVGSDGARRTWQTAAAALGDRIGRALLEGVRTEATAGPRPCGSTRGLTRALTRSRPHEHAREPRRSRRTVAGAHRGLPGRRGVAARIRGRGGID